MKKIILVMLIILSCGVLYGCADITYEIEVSTENKITQILTVVPDYDALHEMGYTKSTVNERIITTFNDIVKMQENKFKEYDENIASEDFKNEVLGRVTHSHQIDEDKIILKSCFDSYTDYIYYYCAVEEVSSSPDKTTRTPLYYFTKSTSKSIFADLEGSSMLEYIYSMFSLTEEEFDYKNLTYHYIYSLADSKQRSNADEIYYSNKLYHHKWNFDKTNINRDIKFYKFKQIITTNWYYLALFLALMFLIVMVFVAEVERYEAKNKQKNSALKT